MAPFGYNSIMIQPLHSSDPGRAPLSLKAGKNDHLPSEPVDGLGGQVPTREVDLEAMSRSIRAEDGPAPAGPGATATWTDANKDFILTSRSGESRVWATAAEGRITEVFYPTIDKANTRELSFIVSDGETFAEPAHQAGRVRVEQLDDGSMAYRYVLESEQHGWRLSFTTATDPERNTLLMDVDFQSQKPLDLYVVHDTSMKNSGMHDTAYVQGGALVAQEADMASALTSTIGFQEANIGFKDTSDGVAGLLRDFRLPSHHSSASDGNVVQVARVTRADQAHFTLGLGFGGNPDEAVAQAHGSLGDGFDNRLDRFNQGWNEYLGGLRQFHLEKPELQRLLKVSAMVSAALEDKQNPGACIASLSVPWGSGVNANEDDYGGYHLVWPRDLYQVATAAHAAGDDAMAHRLLDFLLKAQIQGDNPQVYHNGPNGPEHNPALSGQPGGQHQNLWVDGRPYWSRLQMDQVAWPIVLASELGRDDKETYERHLRPAAHFIADRGPGSEQERWEEQSGLSPSTLAAEIAGLVCAARIAEQHGDHEGAQKFLSKADEWKANIREWCATRSGPYIDPENGVDEYFVRVSKQNDQGQWDPNAGSMHDPNSGGQRPLNSVVDHGFLEFVRLGILDAKDPLVVKSLKVVDRVLKHDSPNGPVWYRYNPELEGYGEKPWGNGFFELGDSGRGSGKGRPWPFLGLERALREIAAGNTEYAQSLIGSAVDQANEGAMLPEQVWDRPTNHEGEWNLGKAAWTLRSYLADEHRGWDVSSRPELLDTAAGIGGADRVFGRGDLEAVVNNEQAPQELREAARFVLSSPTVLSELDTAAGVDGPDGRIGVEDLHKAIEKHPQDFAPSKLVHGEGTGSATPLGWAHAEFIMAVAALATSSIPGCPAAVALRYLGRENQL